MATANATIKETEVNPTERLFQEYRSTDSLERKSEIENDIIASNMTFIWYMVHTFNNIRIPKDILYSAALFGMMKAIRKFKPDKGVKFNSFAGTCMANEMRREIILSDRTKRIKQVSIDTPLTLKNDNLTILDCIEDDTVDVEEEVNGRTTREFLLREARKVLTKKQYMVFEIRLSPHSPTQKEIGQTLGITGAAISTLESAAIRRMKKHLKEVINV